MEKSKKGGKREGSGRPKNDNNKSQNGAVDLGSSYLSFLEKNNRCSHFTKAYNELILKSRSLFYKK